MAEALRERFKQLFEASGMTQAELSRQLVVERATVNGILRDRAMPSPSLVKLLEMVVAAGGNTALDRGEDQIPHGAEFDPERVATFEPARPQGYTLREGEPPALTVWSRLSPKVLAMSDVWGMGGYFLGDEAHSSFSGSKTEPAGRMLRASRRNPAATRS